MSEEQATILRDAYDAFRRADTDAVLARMAPDVHWRLPGRSIAGRHAVEELLTRMRSRRWVGADLEVHTMTPEDGRVLVRGVCGERFVHAWRLDGGVAIELDVLQLPS